MKQALAAMAFIAALVGWTLPAFARGGDETAFEGIDYVRVNCPKGTEGSCFKILRSESFLSTVSLARTLGTTPQAIRAENPRTTIPVCCHARGRCDYLQVPSLLSRTSQDYWRTNCPDETKQGVYVIPNTTIVISGRQRLTFNEKVAAIGQLESCPDPQSCIDLMRTLATNAEGLDRLHVIPPEPEEADTDEPPAFTPTSGDPPAPPVVSPKSWASYIPWDALLNMLAVIVGFVLIALFIADYVRKHQAYDALMREFCAREESIRRLQNDGEQLRRWLAAVLSSTERLIGSAVVIGETPIDRARRLISEMQPAQEDLRSAAETAGVNPADGVAACLKTLASQRSVALAEQERLNGLLTEAGTLLATVDAGLRSLHFRLSQGRFRDVGRGAAFALASVVEATNELASAYGQTMTVIHRTVFGGNAHIDALSDTARIEETVRALDAAYADLATQAGDNPSSLVERLRVVLEGKESAVAHYRSEFLAQTGRIASLEDRLRRAERALARTIEVNDRDSDGSGSGGGVSGRTLVPPKEGAAVPPAPESDATRDRNWSTVGEAGTTFRNALAALSPDGRIGIRRADDLLSLSRVWVILRRLKVFFGGDHPWSEGFAAIMDSSDLQSRVAETFGQPVVTSTGFPRPPSIPAECLAIG